jgi:hypothetical protein
LVTLVTALVTGFSPAPTVAPTVASGEVVAVIGVPEPPSTVLSEAMVLPTPPW